MTKRIRGGIQQNDLTLGMEAVQTQIMIDSGCDGTCKCNCNVCQHKNPLKKITKPQITSSVDNSDKWLHQLLKGLTVDTARTLRLYVPDICFPCGEILQFYQTNKKQNRIQKLPGIIPVRFMYSTLVRMRKQYKATLEESFQKSMANVFDLNTIHKRYEEYILPNSFRDGSITNILNSNKANFKNYVFHSNNNFIMKSIQQHIMNDREPFCRYRLTNGDCSILNQKEFFNITSMKIDPNISFVQSFIKNRKQVETLYESTYNCYNIDEKNYNKAQKEVILLLGGGQIFGSVSDELDHMQQESFRLMKVDERQYINIMSYKIVHYLAMGSRIYIQKLRLRWMVNDLGNVYLQQVLQYQTLIRPYRKLKYLFPKVEISSDYFRDSKFFLEARRNIKLANQKSSINQADPPRLETIFQTAKKKNKTKIQSLHSKTIQIVPTSYSRYKQPKNTLQLQPLHISTRHKRTLKKSQRSTNVSMDTLEID